MYRKAVWSRKASVRSSFGLAVCFTIPILVGRPTRGLAKSYHGDPSNSSDEFLVHTEFGADAWCLVVQAAFTSVAANQVCYPAATALSAWWKTPKHAFMIDMDFRRCSEFLDNMRPRPTCLRIFGPDQTCLF